MATPSASSYNADAIEVLSGLDPVRKRPGMYTDTSRPNHLAQEVIDNSVDEALAGHAKSVQVILHADHSLEVSDDGRGMPVDIHPEEGVSGVELILTKLHAGGKFSNKNYQFSGGLHGVGISVVNALSTQVRVKVKRDGNEYQMTFADGDTLAAFLRQHPEHRHTTRRVLMLRGLPYAEIHDNLLATAMLPIDILRCKLAFFGATRFDPRSDLWVRISLFQGAPFPDELAGEAP